METPFKVLFLFTGNSARSFDPTDPFDYPSRRAN
jgi:hypothetical protein